MNLIKNDKSPLLRASNLTNVQVDEVDANQRPIGADTYLSKSSRGKNLYIFYLSIVLGLINYTFDTKSWYYAHLFCETLFKYSH